MGPEERYHAELTRTGFTHDPAQERVVVELQALYEALGDASENLLRRALALHEQAHGPNHAGVLALRSDLVLAEIALSYDCKKRAEQAMLHAESAASVALNLGAIRWRVEALTQPPRHFSSA